MTALGVAAPLAIEATRADEVRFATPSEDEPQTTPSGDDDGPTLIETDGDAKGGIGSRAPVKAQAQTSKSENSGATTPTTAAAGSGPALTNPSSTVADEFEDPLAPTVSTTLVEASTTPTVLVTTPPPTEATTTSSTATTSTTAATTSSSSSTSTTDGALTGG